MITAAEARALDPEKMVEADLAVIDQAIRKAAEMGETEIRAPYALCMANGYAIQFKRTGVADALEEAGYKVTSRSEDRQFVDVWIEISWKDTPND